VTSLGIGLVCLAFIGLLVYYVKVGINAKRNEAAVEALSKAQADALSVAEQLAADKEREERRDEAAAVVGIDREHANKLLLDALKDDLN